MDSTDSGLGSAPRAPSSNSCTSDVVVQTVEDFLVIATHGRGCYVLDVRELRQ